MSQSTGEEAKGIARVRTVLETPAYMIMLMQCCSPAIPNSITEKELLTLWQLAKSGRQFPSSTPALQRFLRRMRRKFRLSEDETSGAFLKQLLAKTVVLVTPETNEAYLKHFKERGLPLYRGLTASRIGLTLSIPPSEGVGIPSSPTQLRASLSPVFRPRQAGLGEAKENPTDYWALLKYMAVASLNGSSAGSKSILTIEKFEVLKQAYETYPNDLNAASTFITRHAAGIEFSELNAYADAVTPANQKSATQREKPVSKIWRAFAIATEAAAFAQKQEVDWQAKSARQKIVADPLGAEPVRAFKLKSQLGLMFKVILSQKREALRLVGEQSPFLQDWVNKENDVVIDDLDLSENWTNQATPFLNEAQQHPLMQLYYLARGFANHSSRPNDVYIQFARHTWILANIASKSLGGKDVLAEFDSELKKSLLPQYDRSRRELNYFIATVSVLTIGYTLAIGVALTAGSQSPLLGILADLGAQARLGVGVGFIVGMVFLSLFLAWNRQLSFKDRRINNPFIRTEVDDTIYAVKKFLSSSTRFFKPPLTAPDAAQVSPLSTPSPSENARLRRPSGEF